MSDASSIRTTELKISSKAFTLYQTSTKKTPSALPTPNRTFYLVIDPPSASRSLSGLNVRSIPSTYPPPAPSLFFRCTRAEPCWILLQPAVARRELPAPSRRLTIDFNRRTQCIRTSRVRDVKWHRASEREESYCLQPEKTKARWCPRLCPLRLRGSGMDPWRATRSTNAKTISGLTFFFHILLLLREWNRELISPVQRNCFYQFELLVLFFNLKLVIFFARDMTFEFKGLQKCDTLQKRIKALGAHSDGSVSLTYFDRKIWF